MGKTFTPELAMLDPVPGELLNPGGVRGPLSGQGGVESLCEQPSPASDATKSTRADARTGMAPLLDLGRIHARRDLLRKIGPTVEAARVPGQMDDQVRL